jgi:hypothetical protein
MGILVPPAMAGRAMPGVDAAAGGTGGLVDP